MIKQILSFSFLLMATTGFARDFAFTYEGKTLNYTVLDEEAKTCATKAGYGYPQADLIGWEYGPGSEVTGTLVIPEYANDGSDDYEVVELSDMSFMLNKELISVKIPTTVTAIGSRVFQECPELTSVVIPESVTSIGGATFQNCIKLVDFKLPAGLETIEGWLFLGCSFETIVLPESVKSIGAYAFAACENLSSINLPSDVTDIMEGAFSNCPDLKSFEVPVMVETLGKRAFADCRSLESISLPSNLIEVGVEAFENCENLKDVELPESLTYIESRAFKNCIKFNSITLPASTCYLGSAVFEGCRNIKNVVVNAQTPPVMGINAFDERIYETAFLTVPSNCIEAYYDHYSWGQFKNREAGVENISAESVEEIARYNLDGMPVNADENGVIVIKYSDGTTAKIFNK
ncbi:MAG: leucine-rich repeat domain-containing protein [Muribaculaceae bacterium]|nr:leucine-rich repeat domain-containing protein [Muribaculaceae bacterium]